MSNKTTSRTSLPSISNPQLTYSQRYQHMTKIANYAEMNQNQIWKQYQKLRGSLKQLNQQVLYHMQKKAYSNLKNVQKNTNNKDSQGILLVLDDQKKTNQIRTQNFNNQFTKLQERIKYLISKPNLMDELNKQQQLLKNKIKQTKKDNKELRKDHEVQGRDLVNNNALLDKIMIQQQRLNRVFKQHKKHQQHLNTINQKIQIFKQKVSQLQKAIDLRVQQFSHQQNFIAQQIHLQRYQQLKKQKQVIGKYQTIYNRNYLMKLKELDSLNQSIQKHQRIISETQTNILSVRKQIQIITNLISNSQRKRYHSSSVLTTRKIQKNTQQPSTQNILQLDANNKTKTVNLNDKNN